MYRELINKRTQGRGPRKGSNASLGSNQQYEEANRAIRSQFSDLKHMIAKEESSKEVASERKRVKNNAIISSAQISGQPSSDFLKSTAVSPVPEKFKSKYMDSYRMNDASMSKAPINMSSKSVFDNILNTAQPKKMKKRRKIITTVQSDHERDDKMEQTALSSLNLLSKIDRNSKKQLESITKLQTQLTRSGSKLLNSEGRGLKTDTVNDYMIQTSATCMNFNKTPVKNLSSKHILQPVSSVNSINHMQSPCNVITSIFSTKNSQSVKKRQNDKLPMRTPMKKKAVKEDGFSKTPVLQKNTQLASQALTSLKSKMRIEVAAEQQQQALRQSLFNSPQNRDLMLDQSGKITAFRRNNNNASLFKSHDRFKGASTTMTKLKGLGGKPPRGQREISMQSADQLTKLQQSQEQLQQLREEQQNRAVAEKIVIGQQEIMPEVSSG